MCERYSSAQVVESDNNANDKVTEYLGNFIYTDGELSTILTEEGRIVSTGNTYRYEYNLKDHLGNTRATFAGTSFGAALIQTTSYYPFGLVLEQENFNTSIANYEKNNYLYNGKELQDEGFGGVSLGWLDYGARMYDPAIGRWHCIDPLAYSYYGFSPYNYCLNNPISFIDPNGMWVEGAGFFRNVFRNDDYIHANNLASEANAQDLSRDYSVIKSRNNGKREVGVFSCEKPIDISGDGTTSKHTTYTTVDSDGGLGKTTGGYQIATLASGAATPTYTLGNLMVGGTLLKPIFGLGSKAFSSVAGNIAAKSSANMTTVGRWMSKGEYAVMKNGTSVLEGAGGQTFVTKGGSHVFSSASKGSIYAEFQVSTNSLLQGGKAGWYKMLGPNAAKSQQYCFKNRAVDYFLHIKTYHLFLK